MKYLAILLLTLPMISNAEVKVEDLIGTWKSMEAETLKSMEQEGQSIPPELQKAFRNKFYGRLTTIIERDRAKTYYPDTEKLDDASWYPYSIIESRKSYVVIKYENPWTKEWSETKWYLQGNRMYTVTDWGFKEYFEKIK